MAAVTELAPESDARRKEGLSQKEACCVHPPGCGRISGLSTACSLGFSTAHCLYHSFTVSRVCLSTAIRRDLSTADCLFGSTADCGSQDCISLSLVPQIAK